jgi:3-isopropylmalate dehydrogenase
MGLMPSASIGSENALYEPIHGSYPEATGKQIANPIASILSLSMMLEYSFDLKDESQIINRAVEESLTKRFTTPDLNIDNKAYSTKEVGDYIVDFIKKN